MVTVSNYMLPWLSPGTHSSTYTVTQPQSSQLGQGGQKGTVENPSVSGSQRTVNWNPPGAVQRTSRYCSERGEK